MNPLFYLFFAIYYIDIQIIFFSTIIPILTGTLAIYLTFNVLKEYTNPKEELMLTKNDMDLIPVKPLKFDI